MLCTGDEAAPPVRFLHTKERGETHTNKLRQTAAMYTQRHEGMRLVGKQNHEFVPGRRHKELLSSRSIASKVPRACPRKVTSVARRVAA